MSAAPDDLSAPSVAGPAAYRALTRRMARIAALEESLAMLGWDTQTMMPSGAGAARGTLLAELSVMAHELLVAPETGDLLAAAVAAPADLDAWQRANVAAIQHKHAHAAGVPADLVEAASKAATACELIWRQARPANDFAAVQAPLADLIRLTAEIGDAKAAGLGLSRYDALIDGFDPGLRQADIDPIFADLAGFLPALRERALARQAAAPALPSAAGPFAIEAQRQLVRAAAGTLGFDFTQGRLDESAHPFCGGIADDVRMTTRYEAEDFARALMGTLHETGHALYQAGLPAAWRGQPVGDALGMAVHESQSLLWEMQVARGAFLGWLAPRLAAAFGGPNEAWTVPALTQRLVRVEPGLIRVDADEVTYPSHIMVRYALEPALLSGDLPVAELPGAWAEAYRRHLGIAPADDRTGCLQDIHWYGGAFGYFPSYTMGALLAAQLMEAARAALPGLEEDLAAGRTQGLLGWLRHHVHGRGRSVAAAQLIREATGAPLGTAAFKRHLERRYAGG